MTMPSDDLLAPVAAALPLNGRAVIAVSGGLDSMTLLDAVSKVRAERKCVVTVATFDHRSGPHSAVAAAHVLAAASACGLEFLLGTAEGPARTEGAWRAARWQFLWATAEALDAVVLTAHNRDDQVETVLMRALRGAGTRGLAALRAPSPVRRPFLTLTRGELREYAIARGIRWLEDPTNESRAFLRNRIRHDLLPALRAARPSIDAELHSISEEAARWRVQVAGMVDATFDFCVTREAEHFVLDVSAHELQQQSAEALGIIWPELASRVGLALDRRGTCRAAEFTRSERVGARIQLSGGWEIHRSRDRLELRRKRSDFEQTSDIRSFAPPMTWGRWSFEPCKDGRLDVWRLSIPAGHALSIRRWRPGDRLTVRQGGRLITRKVRYFLSDAGIAGHIRASWPVVLVGDEIVWIPGVRRSDAAAVRSGGPVVTYVCDYLDRRS